MQLCTMYDVTHILDSTWRLLWNSIKIGFLDMLQSEWSGQISNLMESWISYYSIVFLDLLSLQKKKKKQAYKSDMLGVSSRVVYLLYWKYSILALKSICN